MKEGDGQFSGESGILGIYSGGGSGHKQALFAIKSQIEELFPNLPFKTFDILKDTLPKPLALSMTKGWDRAKAEGDIKKLKALYRGSWLGIPNYRLADFLVFIPSFFSVTLCLLRNREISKVIDTQPLATKAIVRAIRFVSAVTGRRITLTKVMTDMPTIRAEHFANPSRLLNDKDLEYYELMSAPHSSPLCGEDKEQWLYRQERFWNQHFGLSLLGGEVRYHNYPVRKPFLEEFNPIKNLKINYNSEEEKRWLKELIGPLIDKEDTTLSLTLESSAIIGLIALGSQAVRQATKAYLFDLICVAKKNREQHLYLFVACGQHKMGQESLFQELCVLIKEIRETLPANLTIIPLGLQGASSLAALKSSASFGIYSAGGLTSMELTVVAQGKLFIHSGSLPLPPGKEYSQRHLLNGIPLWEAGNAKHMVKEMGAMLVTPGRRFRHIVEEIDYSSLPNRSRARQPKNSILTPATR